MKIYVINLAREVERFERLRKRLLALRLGFVRIEAIDGKKLAAEQKLAAVNRFRWWCAIGWPVRDGEIGCAMSHYSIFRKLDTIACILEDDVVLADGLPNALNEIERWIDSNRPQVVLLSNHTSEKGRGICRSSGDKFAEAYVITPEAARVILKTNWPMKVPCDWWDRWSRAGLIELYHYFPTMSSQNRIDFSSSTVGADIKGVAGLSLPKFFLHKTKRLFGKILDNVLPL